MLYASLQNTFICKALLIDSGQLLNFIFHKHTAINKNKAWKQTLILKIIKDLPGQFSEFSWFFWESCLLPGWGATRLAILPYGRQGQKEPEFMGSLGSIANSRPCWNSLERTSIRKWQKQNAYSTEGVKAHFSVNSSCSSLINTVDFLQPSPISDSFQKSPRCGWNV